MYRRYASFVRGIRVCACSDQKLDTGMLSLGIPVKRVRSAV
jgi:hypothetical protein